MSKVEKFEDLIIWQNSRKLVNEVYAFTKSCKDYGFNDQIQRAAISIMNNISEGFEIGSDPQFNRYLSHSKGSCGEVRNMIYIAEDLKYLNADKAEHIKNICLEVSRGLQTLKNYLKKSESPKIRKSEI